MEKDKDKRFTWLDKQYAKYHTNTHINLKKVKLIPKVKIFPKSLQRLSQGWILCKNNVEKSACGIQSKCAGKVSSSFHLP